MFYPLSSGNWRALKLVFMTFSTIEKREFILAMQSMIAIEGPHPSKKKIFDSVFKTLDVNYDESISFLSYINNPRINWDEHYSVIQRMDLEKKKSLISVLTVLSTIGEGCKNEKVELLTGYRACCDLSCTTFSTLDAVMTASKFILK